MSNLKGRFPFAHIVPTELEANLEFRHRMSKEGFESKDKAAVIRAMCKRDPLFFIGTFCWTHNPMWFPNCPRQPFIPHAFQRRLVQKILVSLERVARFTLTGERTDLGCLKSRETGASWTWLLTLLWRWQFYKDQSFLLVSRTKDMVDKANDKDALMPKIDYSIAKQPSWLRPRLGPNDRVELKLYNPETGSIISGTATTGDIGRGGRRQGILLDEYAFFDRRDGYAALKAAQGASLCCWYVSTPNGTGNAFHDVMEDADIEKIELCWEDIPHKAAGMYRAVDGELGIIDKEFNFPSDYKFILDGQLRSIWWDATERRTPIKSLMAQEHGRSFIGSGSPFFSADERERISASVRDPVTRIPFKLSTGKQTYMDLWCRKEFWEKPPVDRRYVLGVDVSLGTGASNSCIVLFDGRMTEKIGEYADPDTGPVDLAEIACSIGRRFEDWDEAPALIIWEVQGVGRSFGKKLSELEYENPYWATSIIDPAEKKAKYAGFNASPQAKQMVLRGLGVALLSGQFEEVSKQASREYERFEHFQGGIVAHSKAMSSEDPSGARENHGDRVTANALALYGLSGLGEAIPDISEVASRKSWLYAELEETRSRRKTNRRRDGGWLTYRTRKGLLGRLSLMD